MKTAVIGGGAAGLCAAIAASEKGDSVALFERMDRVGKKILATGNGRCNLLNVGEPRYGEANGFVKRALSVFSCAELISFFERLGLTLREEGEGRVYPATGQAATVLNVLLKAIERQKVSVRLSTPVSALQKKDTGFWVNGEPFDKVIAAGGGMAQNKLGSNGSCYPLLAALGHPIVPPVPSLTPLETGREHLRGLSGLRIKADVSLKKEGRVLAMETGELLFTDYGVSGVCVMQLSRAFEEGATLHIDLRRTMNIDCDCFDFFKKRRKTLSGIAAGDFLTGLFATPLARVIASRATLSDLSDAALLRLAHVVTDFALPDIRLRGFDFAQVTRGGIALSSIRPETMASTLVNHLHAAGEVLDVDGDCGGFNLMFAFISGLIAGFAR